MNLTELPSISSDRSHLMGSYVENMKIYLKTQFPEAREKELDFFLRGLVNNRCQGMVDRLNDAKVAGEDLGVIRPRDEQLWPTIQVVKHVDAAVDPEKHSYGNLSYFGDYDLLEHTNKMKSKIIAPMGTCYESIDKCSGFLKEMVDFNGKARKAEKKLMLKAKKEGNRNKEIFHNNNQAALKIGNNSLIGGMGSGFNFLSSVANFNGVTSIARFFIRNSYAHAERFLESNFYFSSEEDVLNFLVSIKRCMPDHLLTLSLCETYGLKCPTADEVYDFLCDCLHRYMFAHPHPSIRMFLASMMPGELCFVYYMSNMKHLVRDNESYFRPWIDSFLHVADVVTDTSVSPSELYDLDGDLLVVLSTVCEDEVPVNAKGNTLSLYDCVDSHPDLARRFVCVGKHMASLLADIDPLFSHFMNHRVAISKVKEHPKMFRDCVILSDTDSIIFTTKTWVDWYQGDLSLSKKAFDMNALVVYWMSKANGYLLYNVSVDLGALGKDILTMNMKNEFMMPIEILTSLKKHYASIIAIQEGVFFKVARMDIKGVNLRGSNYCQETLNYMTWFIRTTIEDIYLTGKVSARKKILEVLRFERMVYDSVSSGEARFLNITAVRPPEEYKDASRTIYFNFLFWEQVFGEKYGNIPIPTKCYTLPLVNVHLPQYSAFLEASYPDIFRKLQDFFVAHSDKVITRIPINPLTPTIPEELRPITNFKAVVYSNGKPLYLILKSLGINIGNSDKQNALFSEMHGWVTSTDAKLAEPYVLNE